MLQILIAILAGIVTIAAPCILPLLPILLGVSVGQKSKTRPFFIVLGFVLVFSVAALLLSYLSTHLGLNPNIIRNIGIVVLGIFGILLMWPLPFELLAMKLNPLITKAGSLTDPTKKGNLSGFILGMTLGLVWTPCAGPVLASALTLIALQKQIATAGILLFAYSIGAGVPMLIIAYGGQYITNKVSIIAKYTELLQKVFGVIIILMAIAFYFNLDTKFYTWILAYCPTFNSSL